ncbi:AAA family ATPase [Thermus caldilimi]|uniref:AAA family ATPase n=1 Tax=Thermus caldilimi TaxID=2483360 RepID=UPI0010764991|nr:AAA family ATPase [Thermus caldilimi]
MVWRGKPLPRIGGEAVYLLLALASGGFFALERRAEALVLLLVFLLLWAYFRTGRPRWFGTGAAALASILFAALLLGTLGWFLALFLGSARGVAEWALGGALVLLTLGVWSTLRGYRVGRGWTREGAEYHAKVRETRAKEVRQDGSFRDFPRLEALLKERVIGQDRAVEAVIRGLKRKAAGLTRREKPLSLMLAGPTGTGKTELAKTLAEALRRPLVRYDMNAFGQEFAATALVGSPPGYVGSEEPGRLYRDLAAHPEGVFLFDEMEKAHPLVLDPLLQLLDEGRFQELSQGQVAQAHEAILVFTTNLLSQEAFLGQEIPEGELRERLVHLGLRPEFVNRLDVVVAFRPFDEATLREIAKRHLWAYLRRWQEANGLRLQVEVEEGVYAHLASRCDPRFGARDLQRVIESTVGDALAEAFLVNRVNRSRKGSPRHLLVGLEDLGVFAEIRVVLS